MAEKLNPSEAQRKAMALALARRVGRESFAQGDLDVVYHQIEAANSIPEGAPVGTGALRPDGAFVAIRVAGPYWTYVNVNQDDDAVWPHPDAADSWPVIFAPGEAVGSGPTTVGGGTYNPREQSPREAGPSDGLPDVTAQQEPAVRGTVEDALRPDDVKLLETNPEEFVRRTRKPRVLPSLDCEEARDGTVWSNRFGVQVVFDTTGTWRFKEELDAGYDYDGVEVLTTPNYGPFTEVLPDVG